MTSKITLKNLIPGTVFICWVFVIQISSQTAVGQPLQGDETSSVVCPANADGTVIACDDETLSNSLAIDETNVTNITVLNVAESWVSDPEADMLEEPETSPENHVMDGYNSTEHPMLGGSVILPDDPEIDTSNYTDHMIFSGAIFHNMPVFAATETCSEGQYTLSVADPNCYTCPTGKFRTINSAPVAGKGQYGPWFPMIFRWGSNNWHFANKYYDSYGTMQQPVFYSPTPYETRGYGCAHFQVSKWYFVAGAITNDGRDCTVGGAGYSTGFFGSDPRLQDIINASTNNQWCITCGRGKYSTVAVVTSGSDCISCSPGTWSSSDPSTSCTACVAGKYSAVVAASSISLCLLCDGGEYSLPSATVCISCPPGTHGSFTAERRYPPKKFTSESASTSTTVLGQSVFRQDVTLDTVGISFGSGQYSLYKSSGQNTFVPSQLVDFSSNSAYWAGSYSATGAFIGTTRYIISGYYGEWAMIKLPTAILLTRYIFRRWTDTSEVRMPGIWKCYGSNNGVNFEEIPGGSQNTRITSLPNGAYEKILVQLPTKTYTWYAWAVSQLYGDFTTMVIGEIEVYGMEPVSGGSCASCDAGKYSTIVSALTPSVCIPCDVGKYSSAASSICTSCEAGKYSSVTSSTACTSCDAGKYSTVASASSSVVCISCDAGKYSSVVSAQSSVACTSCSAGKYSTVVSASSSVVCISCDAGKYSSVISAQSAVACTPCDAGKYSAVVSASSSTVCTLCDLCSTNGFFRSGCGGASAGTCERCINV